MEIIACAKTLSYERERHQGAEKSCVAAAKTIAKEEMERRGWIVKVYLCCTEKFSVSSLFSKEPHEFLDRWEHDIICAITGGDTGGKKTSCDTSATV